MNSEYYLTKDKSDIREHAIRRILFKPMNLRREQFHQHNSIESGRIIYFNSKDYLIIFAVNSKRKIPAGIV